MNRKTSRQQTLRGRGSDEWKGKATRIKQKKERERERERENVMVRPELNGAIYPSSRLKENRLQVMDTWLLAGPSFFLSALFLLLLRFLLLHLPHVHHRPCSSSFASFAAEATKKKGENKSFSLPPLILPRTTDKGKKERERERKKNR